MTVTLSVFPLGHHVFPGGRLALRIFEPRYIRMVRDSFSTPKGFVMAMKNSLQGKDPEKNVYPVATWVQVVDFAVLDDGMLGIVVEGVRKVEINTIQVESDGLRKAKVTELESWSQETESDPLLSDKLTQVFREFPELENLYQNPCLDSASWVCLRWLEVLPLPSELKHALIARPDHLQAEHFLKELIGHTG